MSLSIDFDFDDIAHDVKTSEMIAELEERLNYGKIKPSDLETLHEMFSETPGNFEVQTLDDEIKLEHLLKVFSKYTAAEIENLIPERP